MIQQINPHQTVETHTQNIKNAFRISQTFSNEIDQIRGPTETTPTQKAIQQVLKPEPQLTQNFISSTTSIEDLYEYSVYPQLYQLYVSIADDLIQAVTTPTTPIVTGKTEMNTHLIRPLLKVIEGNAPIPTKIMSVINLIPSESMRAIYKKQVIDIHINKINSLLSFARNKISQQIVDKIVLNNTAMKYAQNDEKILTQKNDELLEGILKKHTQTYTYETLANKLVSESIKKKFIHQGRISAPIHWKQVNDADTVDVARLQAQKVARQFLAQHQDWVKKQRYSIQSLQ